MALPPKDPKKSAAALRRWAKRNDRKAAELALDDAPGLDITAPDTTGPPQIPGLPDVAQWWELQLQTRQSDVGFFMALFPWASDDDVRKRFMLTKNTLGNYKNSAPYRKGYEQGMGKRDREQDEAAKGFFKGRVLDYARRLDELAMGDDARVALAAVTRILESQGTLDQQRTSIVNVAIQLQQGMNTEAQQLPQASALALPQSSGLVVDGIMRELGKEVIPHGEEQAEVVQQGQEGRQGDAVRGQHVPGGEGQVQERDRDGQILAAT